MSDPKPTPDWLAWYAQACDFAVEQGKRGVSVERMEDPSGRSISFGKVMQPPSMQAKK